MLCKIRITDQDDPELYDINFPCFHIVNSSLEIGLITYYPFNGNADDESGNGYHGTIIGATLTSNRFGEQSKAYIFDGINDYIKVPINLPETQYTYSLWFKTNNPNTGISSVRDTDLGPSNDRNIWLNSGDVNHRLWNNQTITTSGTNYADNLWHHLVIVVHWKFGQIIYIDGEQKAIGNKNRSDFDTDAYFDIGYAGYAGFNYFDGSLDDIRIYGRILPTQEIFKLFKEGSLLSLCSPNGKEKWLKESTQKITWICDTAISTINLDYSTDNGQTWKNIADNVYANASFYNWILPNTSSSQCKIKISNTNDPSIFDMSDELFYIVSSSLDVGLVAYYPFDGNSDDYSGYGNNADELWGGVSFVEGQNGQAVNFGGYYNKGHVRIPNSPSLQFASKFSFSEWVKLNSMGGMNHYGGYTNYGNHKIFAKEHDNPGGFSAGIGAINSNTIEFGFSNSIAYHVYDLSLKTNPVQYNIGEWLYVTYIVSTNEA